MTIIKTLIPLSRTFCKAATYGCLATTLALSPAVFADDSEIFVSQGEVGDSDRPNVMFILDTSGSMNWGDQGVPGTRLRRMSDAMTQLLDSTTDVNVGLMRFNGSNGGGAVLHELAYIDDQVCSTDNCDVVTEQRNVNSDDSDGYETLSSGQTTELSSTIQLGSNTRTAIRFTDVQIPPYVQITSATIEFVASSTRYGSAKFTVRAEDAPNSAPVAAVDDNISSRPLTTASAQWNTGSWYSNTNYRSPNIANVLQEVVNRNDWCAGRPLTLVIDGPSRRYAHAHEANNSMMPVLRYTYDPLSTTNATTCVSEEIITNLAVSSDDGREYSNGTVDTNDYYPLLPTNGAERVALRFRDVKIPQGAVIDSAAVTLRNGYASWNSGTVNYDVSVELSNNSPTLKTYRRRDISRRSVTSNSIAWNNPPGNLSFQFYDSPNLAPLVQQVVDRQGWRSGNAMSMIIRKSNGNGWRRYASGRLFYGKPKLTIKYSAQVSAGEAPGFITVRDKLKSLVSGMVATGGTPIVDALYEASNYFGGQPVDYGKTRGYSYYVSGNHRVSTPASYTGGSVNIDARCTASDPNNYYCRTENIGGTPTYISPIESSCQSNHIVLLSDGEPSTHYAHSKVLAKTQAGNCSDGNWARRCGVELAQWMNTADQNTAVAGVQTVKTHTVGLSINSTFLQNLASAGGGQYHTVSSSQALASAFNEILSEVAATETSIVSAGTTVNQFNRLTHRDDLYFSVFKPEATPRWSGNLKKYKLKADASGISRVHDSSTPPIPAINESTGYFDNAAKSFWSTTADGSTVQDGGAANRLSLTDAATGSDRNIYTYTGSGAPNYVDLTHANHALDESNKNRITKALLGIESEDNKYHTNLLKWARGVDILDDDNDGSTTDIRLHMGDPMHSRPLIVNYSGGSETSPNSTVFVSTNEGLLHGFDTETGKERFAFMPKELLGNLNKFFQNESSVRHPYGLDGHLSYLLEDTNNNTTIDSGEKAMLYSGMRRGGRNYYALDINNKTKPKLAWSIIGGETGFEQLGQTWSKMLPTKIKVNGAEKRVLIFAGGYDTKQDPLPEGTADVRREDNIGRAIYIVDAFTGKKIWTGSGVATQSGPGAFAYFSDMKYSIPSNIRVIDIDTDGLADQMYVGDMGGQLWRFDINNFDDGQPLVTGDTIAEFAQSSSTSGARRFFYEPDVALHSHDGEKLLTIGIGSGWRAHPLDNVIDDAYYVIRTKDVAGKPEGYGRPITPESDSYTKITADDLHDVTKNMDAAADLTDKWGWRIRLTRNGEKSMSKGLTVNGKIIFTTFVPEVAASICSVASGSGRVYVLDVLTGAPAIDLNEQGGDEELTLEDQSKALKHGGLPPEAIAVYSASGDPVIMIGTEQPLDEFDFTTEFVRQYWRQPNEFVDLADGSPEE